MNCTCACHQSSGHIINRRAYLGSQIVSLRARVKDLEKLARRTPPKTLVTEWARVQAAKGDLATTIKQLAACEMERAVLNEGEGQERTPSCD